MNGFGPQLSDQSAARRCVSEATSDGSADSGIALQAAVNSPLTLNGVSCRPNDTTDDVDCLDRRDRRGFRLGRHRRGAGRGGHQ